MQLPPQTRDLSRHGVDSRTRLARNPSNLSAVEWRSTRTCKGAPVRSSIALRHCLLGKKNWFMTELETCWILLGVLGKGRTSCYKQAVIPFCFRPWSQSD